MNEESSMSQPFERKDKGWPFAAKWLLCFVLVVFCVVSLR